jgi:hypothetical protein
VPYSHRTRREEELGALQRAGEVFAADANAEVLAADSLPGLDVAGYERGLHLGDGIVDPSAIIARS